MTEARNEIWSLADFLVWEDRQERRHELVDGRPRMMTGVTQAHALIAANVVSLLRSILRGSPCRPIGSDLRIPIPATGNSRYPDVTIDCGPFDANARDASEPTVVFEVLSKSTAWYDQTQKVRDYESVNSIRQYVCISQSEARVTVWVRDRDGRFAQQPDMEAGDLTVLVGTAPIRLPLSGIYEDTGVQCPSEASPS